MTIAEALIIYAICCVVYALNALVLAVAALSTVAESHKIINLHRALRSNRSAGVVALAIFIVTFIAYVVSLF